MTSDTPLPWKFSDLVEALDDIGQQLREALDLLGACNLDLEIELLQGEREILLPRGRCRVERFQLRQLHEFLHNIERDSDRLRELIEHLSKKTVAELHVDPTEIPVGEERFGRNGPLTPIGDCFKLHTTS